MTAGRIRVGIGGWSYPPWRETFYPPQVRAGQELAHASRQLGCIEINATFYATQPRSRFAQWAAETPPDFLFTVKAPRAATQRRRLQDGAAAVTHFLSSGLDALGPKLGPVLWQLAPFKPFDAADIAAFLSSLPRQCAGLPLRHVLEARHPSFCNPDYLALLRAHGVANAIVDAPQRATLADLTADFVYLRCQRSTAQEPLGCPVDAFPQMARCLRAWSLGDEPQGLPRAGPPSPGGPRDVFCFFISAAKERNPAAALALQAALAQEATADAKESQP